MLASQCLAIDPLKVRRELDVVYREVVELAKRRKPVNDARIAAIVAGLKAAAMASGSGEGPA